MGFISTGTYRKGSALASWAQGDTVAETSPYQNGLIELRQEEFAERLGPPDEHGMTLMPTESGERSFRIRVACQHWAPIHGVNDCRYGCAKAEQEQAELAGYRSR